MSLALDRLRRRRIIGHRLRDDEVNLSNVFESELEKAGSVLAIAGWPDLEFEIVQLGIEEGEKLGVGDKDIDEDPRAPFYGRERDIYICPGGKHLTTSKGRG